MKTADEEIIDWLQLINSDNVGPVTFHKLLAKYKSAKEALGNLPSKCKRFPRELAVKEFDLCRSKGIRILTSNDSFYPKPLKNLEDAPPVLYTLGNTEILHHPLSLSVVGARNASINGRKLASRIAYDLTENEIVIVSGMARGIDSAAHKGAMYALGQKGPTIAVLGTGVDVPYPAENTALYHQIAEQGVIISEFPLGTEPQANNFPRRNRLVAGLSLGTLVVEATLHSGSLITARLALEQGKDIFAIPGSPNDARSQGPNKLIKDGAVLVETSEDILHILSMNNHRQIKSYTNKYKETPEQNLFSKAIDKPLKTDNIPVTENIAAAKSVREYLNTSGTYVDEIIRNSGLDSATVSMELLELEMNGIIERQAGNKVALIKK